MLWVSFHRMVAKHIVPVTVSRQLSRHHLRIGIMYPVWSNFEIADMDFWRGPAYTAFFKYLDSTGGFYYEVCVRHVSHFSFFLCLCDTALGRCTDT